MTDLDKLREQILTEFKQVHKLAPADYTENCTNVVMALLTHTLQTYRDEIVAGLPPMRNCNKAPGVCDKDCDKWDNIRTKTLNHVNSVSERHGI